MEIKFVFRLRTHRLWKYNKLLYFLLFVLLPVTGQAQYKNLSVIKSFIKEGKMKEADALLNSDITAIRQSGELDSLYLYFLPKAQIYLANEDILVQHSSLIKLSEEVLNYTREDFIKAEVHFNLAQYYEWVTEWENSYKEYQKGYNYLLQVVPQDYDRLCNIQNNLSIICSRLNRIQEGELHLRKALRLMSLYEIKEPSVKYQVYNSLGTSMYYSSQMDSALYYYSLAYETSKKLTNTPYDKYYRPAMILNNMAGIYPIQGEMKKGMAVQKEAIALTHLFLKDSLTPERRSRAAEFLTQQLDNLSGMNQKIGHYKEAELLLRNAYLQKKNLPVPSELEIAISEVLLGQLYYDMRDYNKALTYLQLGLSKLSGNEDAYYFWLGSAHHTLALIAEKKDKNADALLNYRTAESFYKKAFGDEYDEIFLRFMYNMSDFYAKNEQLPNAIAEAEKAYRYIVKQQGENSLASSVYLLNLADIYLTGKNYKTAYTYATKGIAAVEKIAFSSKSIIDSITAAKEIPKGILTQTKASYYSLSVKNEQTLQPLIFRLEKAVEILEMQKTIILNKEDLSLLVANNKSINDFLKLLKLELYKLSPSKALVNDILVQHEEALYTRIRSRIDFEDIAAFPGVPEAIIKKEKALNELLSASLHSPASLKTNDYAAATETLAGFKKELQNKYPAYYNLRYGLKVDELGVIQKQIPAHTTVVRYIYSANYLTALVMDNSTYQLVSLTENPIDTLILQAQSSQSSITEVSDNLFKLYNILWQPLAGFIQHKKVVIIPDGNLYNISFELLTPAKLKSFKELASMALLNKHFISYNYTTALLGRKRNNVRWNNDFAVFIPGFSDEMKNSYSEKIKDSFLLDQQYLTLLPQPFTVNFGKRIADRFYTSTAIGERSTVNNFKQLAGNHKIIHVGTHAEANNSNPEFSTLIFAKESPYENSNLLYLADIYSCNLTASLAVLTACETGLPGYQDGQGMVSMAHAFNYAGSESILTGLWKIDEQASNMIIDVFYQHLANGIEKDEALQRAKVQYLETTNGRMLHPQYWAGLVIMGDTSPIEIKTKGINAWLVYVTGGTGVFLIFFLVTRYYIRKTKLY